ncbi:MAG: cytochrome c biogenesis protein CcsA [Candidatus Methanoperedens sp.]|nr:cytochrome c biogenesis protein CcsA [Candidatus Methanoperedens sp.]MCZ7405383.1 cytochrome c biogenesis protein CcsA [Candidatus Methanoperedens sp.]
MRKKILFTLTAVLILVSSYLVFFQAPIPIDPGSAAGDPNNFRIFYFHLPIAISAYLCFAVVFISSILYLKSKQQKWDIISLSAAEVGVVFALLTLASGSIWGKSAWNAYWVSWDVRLNTSLILFLIYLSYLMVRQAVEEPEKRARLSAVFGIIGFISVPISFLSVRFYSKMHPCVVPPCPGGGGGGISGVVVYYLLINFAAYFLLVASLIVLKIENERLKEKANELKQVNNN